MLMQRLDAQNDIENVSKQTLQIEMKKPQMSTLVDVCGRNTMRLEKKQLTNNFSTFFVRTNHASYCLFQMGLVK